MSQHGDNQGRQKYSPWPMNERARYLQGRNDVMNRRPANQRPEYAVIEVAPRSRFRWLAIRDAAIISSLWIVLILIFTL